METIKIIDEKTIERNGIKYVPEKAEEPKFKVGQWVVFNPEIAKTIGYYTSFWNKPYVLRITDLSDYTLHFSCDQHPEAGRASFSNHYKCFRPATPQEIESHLRSICEKYVGKKVKCLEDWKMKGHLTSNKFKYESHHDEFWMEDSEHPYLAICVYKDGTFADILPSLKPKPETKEDYKDFIMDWRLSNTSDEIFLAKYDIK
jgi:hypothetical protein